MSRKESRSLSWNAEGETLKGGPSRSKVCRLRLRDRSGGRTGQALAISPLGMDTWSGTMVHPHSYRHSHGRVKPPGDPARGWGVSIQQGVSSPGFTPTNILHEVPHLFHRAGNGECHEGNLGEGSSTWQKLYYPNPPHEKQPVSFNGLSQEQSETPT